MKRIIIFALPMLFCLGCSEDLEYLKDESLINTEETRNAEMVDLGLSVKWSSSFIVDDSSYGSSVWSFGASDDDLTREGETYGSIAGTRFDHATAVNSAWRTPTKEEFEELVEKCTFKIENPSSTNRGIRITGPNGNSVFWGTGNTVQTELAIWTSTFEIRYNHANAYYCKFILYDIRDEVEHEFKYENLYGYYSITYYHYICPVQNK
mgnify:CR=1 FL=1